MMQSFFVSGHVADMVLAVLFCEGVWLARRGWSLAQIAKALGAAVFIVLAVRAALVGAPWYWVALALGASLPIHLLDLRDRMKSKAL
ncbi:MAG: hypothetical protein AAFY51_06450 [Pseudomonadota bacterium]